MKKHWCRDCKGSGRIVKTERRRVHGKEKLYDFTVECPGLIAEQFDTRRLESGQDRAAGDGK